MARYLDENGLALLINNYLKPEDEYSLSSEHPVQNKVLTQTFGNLLSIIDYSKVTGYFHYANAAALPTVNSTGQEEGDFEYNPEKELKIGQRAILDDTQAVMEISAIDSETGAITWINTGLSFGGQVIQVDELPTASAAEEDKIYQYVGDTDALTGVTNGYFYKCVSDGAVSPSYSWENIKVSEGDTIQVETLPTAGASEVGNIYQYIGATNLSFTNGYFYECVEDSGSYNWVEKEVQKNASSVFIGTSSEWGSETSKTDYQVAILTDQPNVNAVNSTTGDIEVVANKNLVFKGTLEEWEALTTAEKKTYDEAMITNDMDTGEVVNGVTDGDMRAVTSNAVYDAITETRTTYTVASWGANISAGLGSNYYYFPKTKRIFFPNFGGMQAAGTNLQGEQILCTLNIPSDFTIPGFGMSIPAILRNSNSGDLVPTMITLGPDKKLWLACPSEGSYNEFRILGASIFSSNV